MADRRKIVGVSRQGSLLGSPFGDTLALKTEDGSIYSIDLHGVANMFGRQTVGTHGMLPGTRQHWLVMGHWADGTVYAALSTLDNTGVLRYVNEGSETMGRGTLLDQWLDLVWGDNSWRVD